MVELLYLLGQGVIALLVATGYVQVVKSLFDLPFLLVGMAAAIVRRVRKATNSQAAVLPLVRVEARVIQIASVIGAAAFLVFGLWDVALLRLWESPFLVAIVLLYSVYQATSAADYNPYVRLVGRSATFFAWPLLGVTLLGVFAPEAIHPYTYATGVILAMIAVSFFSIRVRGPLQMENFYKISERHEDLVQAFQVFRPIVRPASLDPGLWTLAEDIGAIGDAYEQSRRYITLGDYASAEAIISKGELSARRVRVLLQEPPVQERLLAAASRTRDQALEQQKLLEDELRRAGAVADQVTAQTLPSFLSFVSLDPLTRDLEKVQRALDELREIRLAIEYRMQVASGLAPFRDAIEEAEGLLKTAQIAQVETRELDVGVATLRSALQAFETVSIHTLSLLIERHRELHSAHQAVRAAATDVELSLARDWRAHVVNDIVVYVPRKCYTHRVKQAIVLHPGHRLPETARVDFTCLLLELPEEKTLIVSPSARVAALPVAGSRTAGGSLMFSATVGAQVEKGAAEVPISSPAGESASRTVWATATAPVVVLGLTVQGWSIERATLVGAAVGSMLWLLVFAADRYVRRAR